MIVIILLLIALGLFLLDAINVSLGSIKATPAGLAFVTGAMLVPLL